MSLKLDMLEKGKEINDKCDAYVKLKVEVNSLKLKLASFENSSSSFRKWSKCKNHQKTSVD